MKFERRQDYITLIDGLYKSISSQLQHNWGFNPWPIVKIQISYFLHLVYAGKVKEEDFSNKTFTIPPKKISIKDILRLIKYWFICKSLGRKWRKALNNKTLLVSSKQHTNNQNENIYITPFERLLDSISEESMLLIKDQDSEDDGLLHYYRMLHIYHTLKFKCQSYFSSTEIGKAKGNSSLISNHFKDALPTYSIYFNLLIYNTITQNEIYYRTYCDFLKIVSPKLIWTYNYYENNCLALCRAANKLNIKIVEYQHSVISSTHFAYAKWEDIDQYSKFFPSIFWAWDSVSKNTYKSNFSGVKYKPCTIAGGNLQLSSIQKEIVLAPIEERKNKILVCLQGIWIPRYIEDFIVEDNAYTWYFRLHPRYPQDKEKLDALKKRFPSKIETELPNSLPLYEVISKVEYNLTAFSGTAFEAYMLGIKNIIFGDDGYETYKGLIKDKQFGYIESGADLLALLSNPNYFTHSGKDILDINISLKELITKQT